VRARFTIHGRLPGLNEYVAAERANRYKGANMKRDAQAVVIMAIRQQLRGVHFTRPVRIAYTWVERDRRRDLDNISGFGHKVIQDALVVCHVLADDGWDEIAGYSDEFRVDKKVPRIVVDIMEEEE